MESVLCPYFFEDTTMVINGSCVGDGEVRSRCLVMTQNWLARSPDLNPCDFFSWGYLKAEVFKLRSKTLEELKVAVGKEIVANQHDVLERAMQYC